MSQLILASNSERRQQLLRESGFDFVVKTIEVDESLEGKILPRDVAKLIAIKKNEIYRQHFPNDIILTADTVVIASNIILGKPKDEHVAKEMLHVLSGKSHQVVTGVAISSPTAKIVFDDITDVRFKKLTADEINFYIRKYQPFDKAGSYGIQEWIGMIAIESINGSYYNVMGLPVHKVYKALTETFGMPVGMRSKPE